LGEALRKKLRVLTFVLLTGRYDVQPRHTNQSKLRVQKSILRPGFLVPKTSHRRERTCRKEAFKPGFARVEGNKRPATS